MENKFDITELEYSFYALRSTLFNCRSGRHSSDIIASKTAVMNYLDRIADIIKAYRKPSVLTDNNTVDLLLALKDASKRDLPYVLSTEDVNTILKIAEELH